MADRGREDESCRAAHALDLGNSFRYRESVEWLCRNVVQANTVGRAVLQLNVTLPGGAVALYMDPRNHYIMGFRGTDAAYLLKDDNTAIFKSALQGELRQTEIEILEWLGADHGLGGLRTFTRKSGGMEGRGFARKDLDAASKLAEYSSRTNRIGGEQVRASLSLMVYMLSEGARIPMIELDFAYRFYYGGEIRATDLVRSYSDAKDTIALALHAFPIYPRRLAVVKLQKRAIELRQILDKIARAPQFQNPSTLVARLSSGKIQPVPPVAEEIRQFLSIQRELQITDAEKLSAFIRLGQNESAVFLAEQGVIIPDRGEEI
jgi:hypothetical protein